MADDFKTTGEYLRLALEAARKGIGLTSPNPPVGAVVTDQAGKVIGVGHHKKAGGPHAEVEAIRAAERELGAGACREGSIFVTLEPCSTHGKTPPCCDAIRDAGIKQAIWGACDPNPSHNGSATAILNVYGIETGVADPQSPEAAACRSLIAPFAKWMAQKIPWVIAKAGVSLDGRVNRPPGESQWITSMAAREDAHHLRSEVDAIIVGANTVRTDDPALTIRGNAFRPEKVQPWRVVLSRSGDLPTGAKILTDEFRDRTLTYQTEALDRVLEDLASKGCVSVLIEGGANVLGQFFAESLVDELCFYIAPRICNGGLPAVGGVEFSTDAASWQVEDPVISVLDGSNVRIRGRVNRPAS